jgi:hypothetical protein
LFPRCQRIDKDDFVCLSYGSLGYFVFARKHWLYRVWCLSHMSEASHQAPGAVTTDATVRLVEWLSVVLSAAALAWLVNGLDRGLELTDESFYLLSALHADSIRLFFSPTHWVSGALWQMAPSLVAFRAIGLGMVTLSAILLAWGVLRVAPLAGLPITNSSSGRTVILASAASGALLYGSLLSFTPSYNLLGASGACFAMSLGLLSISVPRLNLARVLALMTGVALGVTVLCKFSTGICAAFLVLALQAALTWNQRARRTDSALMIATAVLTITLTVLLKTGFTEALRQFSAGVELVWFAQGDKAALVRLTRSAFDIVGMGQAMLYAFWGPLTCFALASFFRPLLMGCLGAAWFAVLLANGDHLSAGMSRYAVQAVPLAATVTFSLLITIKRWTQTPAICLLVLTLAVLPFGIALGTGNPLQIQILTALAPWGVLIGLLASSSKAVRLPAALISLMFSLVVLMHIVTNGAQPYRMHALPEQTEAVTLPQLGTIKVDGRTAAFVRGMQSAADKCAITRGRPFLDFYNLPVAALILGATPIDSPWLLDADYASLVLKQADPAKLRHAIIAVKLSANGEQPKPPRQMSGFPLGFKLCGRFSGPVDGLPVELWTAY